MLRIYDTALERTRDAGAKAREIARHDRDLARQLRRAAASTTLNIAEGSYSYAGHRRERYRTALGSARESLACLEIAEALGYAKLDGATRDAWDHVVAVLVKLTR